jgi:two-component system cell cycle sensor histidine kinase/response regulator CckA
VAGPVEATVLVVDDDESLRLLCRVNLELDGYRVLEAGTCVEARELIERGGIDAVLLDVHLPDGDGRDLLQELGDRRPPVALFTGTAPAVAVDGLGEAVIPKPFEITQLRETVQQLVSQGGARQVDSGT